MKHTHTFNVQSLLVMVFLMFISAPVWAQNAPDVGQMFANFSSTSVKLMNLLVWAAFVIGLMVSFKGIMGLKDYAEGGGRVNLKTPLMTMIAGVCLVALPGTIDMATETLSLGSNTGTSVFSDGGGGGGIPGMDAALMGVLLFVKLIGHIAIIRGLLIIKSNAEGQQNASMGRALWHIAGGAAAVNINATAQMLAATVGMPLPI